ncbi:MAG: electron transfer flavoprotein subunit alpha/FixB family protein [bacterium]
MSCCAFVEVVEGSVSGGSISALSACALLQSRGWGPAYAVIFAPEPFPGLPRLKDRMRQMGFSRVFLAFSPHLELFRSWLYASLLKKVSEGYPSDYYFFPDSLFSREVAGRLAQEYDAPLLTDIEDFTVKDSLLLWKKTTFGGKYEVLLQTSKTPAFIQVVPGAFEEIANPSEMLEEIILEVPDGSFPEELVSVQEAEKLSVNLEEAQCIVSGGRGLGKPEGFDLIREVAEALGGEVGASRAVVDLGWISYDHQVGQTGKTVRPKLYLAAGISGSVQHRAGIQKSEVIIAINTDPNAPIFTISDYGIVEDLYKILPALLKAIKENNLVPKS